MPSSEQPSSGWVEQRIGRYVLYDAIASGGMATIHFGRLQSQAGFAKTVAIKKLHQHYAHDPEFVAMFMDEARIAARIQHPNVVTTLDVVSIDNELFLVMEYVEGESLARLWKGEHKAGRRIPPDVACGIAIGVLRGLHSAHEAADETGQPLGIIHRDVSPHNIIVGRDGVARVLDFGVAKVAGQLGSTRKGQVKGKLNYMAPEQANGDELDRRADVYAAGVVLWEALTGRRMRDGVDENTIYSQLISGHVTPPSEVADALPAGIDDVMLKALTKDPGQRYATADDFAEDLERVVGSVSPRTIGRWVQRCASEVLAQRAAKRKEIEAKSSGVFMAPDPRLLVPDSSPGSRGSRGASDASIDEPTSATRTDALLGALSMRFDPKVSTNRRRIIVGAIAAFVIGGVVAVASMRASTRDQETRDGPEVASRPRPPVPASPSEAMLQEAPSSPPPAPPPKNSDGRTGERKDDDKAKKHGSEKPPARDCDPPYIITETGVRRYKVECL